MALGPLLRRELLTLSRRGGLYRDRAAAAGIVVLFVAGFAAAAVWQAWPPPGVLRASRVALAASGLVFVAQVAFSMGMVPASVAPRIAGERDRKTLDALLTTPRSGAEIVGGMLCSGLVKPAAGLAATLPFTILLVSEGGVDPRFVLLALAGVVSTALTLAALSIAISAGARTARRSLGYTMSAMLLWIYVPLASVLFLRLLWPRGASWIAPVALGLYETTPLAPVLNAMGFIGRASLVGSLLRMIGFQAVGGGLLALWAAWRLRPASRALFDAAGQAWLHRSRYVPRRSRPPCGDDPVFWNEVHSTRGLGGAERLCAGFTNALLVGILLYGMSWFALPAFAELAERGYGASAHASAALDPNPLVRTLVAKFQGLPTGPAPGAARFEFNSMLRITTAMLELIYLLTLAGAAAESVAAEKERDTWPGLLATPLTGSEILGAKMKGTIYRLKGVGLVIVGLWSAGLAAGAIHPLGAAAAVMGLAVGAWLSVALGVWGALGARNREDANGRVILPVLVLLGSGAVPLFYPVGAGGLILRIGSIPTLTWMSLVSYEDVREVARTGAFVLTTSLKENVVPDARTLLASCAIALAGQAAVALVLTRRSFATFDAVAGRPTRSRRPPPAG